ncbi:hypothetical protein TL16_g11473 [Triparma laevis f. inornata]|uniref:SRCR domain-containing protein n=1 Tax=Triparma laevis f. inornata TaxID=1714386 RepID=A0A9W7BJ68_9STRA|nr:hypothetical protein TL16_g11473 [Triparma laevis f. inornata]
MIAKAFALFLCLLAIITPTAMSSDSPIATLPPSSQNQTPSQSQRKLSSTYTILTRDSYGDTWKGGILTIIHSETNEAVATSTGPETGCKYNPPLKTCEKTETVSLNCGSFTAVASGGSESWEYSWVIEDEHGSIVAEASGTSNANFASPCEACGLGSGAVGATTECEVCPEGKYSDVDGPGACERCEAGKWSDKESAMSEDACRSCEAGKSSSTPGATSISTCTSCSATTVSSDDRTICGCQVGSGNAPLIGQLPDSSNVRIRDNSNNSPRFDPIGVVSGRIEVQPSGETAWGTIANNDWDDTDALIACREIGNELGYLTVSGTALSYDPTPDGSGEVWWNEIGCSGNEETLESCPKQTPTSTSHANDIGITCRFIQPDECEACPAGKSSDSLSISPCQNCEAGKYSDTSSSSGCTSCEAGKASSAVSASSIITCTDCEPGSYANAGASTSCTNCARGKFSSTPSATSSATCQLCEEGKISTTGSTMCFDYCAQGTPSEDDSLQCNCALGSGGDFSFPTSPVNGQLQDVTSIRLRDSSNNSPTFDGEGVVSGRVEVKPPGKSAWGTIHGQTLWDDTDAIVACRQIGNEFGYATVSGTALSYGSTPDGSGVIWWTEVGCSGSEETLEECIPLGTGVTNHQYDIGVTCKFSQAGECELCPPGKFSDVTGIRACTECEAGKYSSATSATSATTSSATSSTSCLACEAGKFSEINGESICESCDPGSYSATEASTLCALCTAGRIRAAGWISPTFNSEGVVEGRIEVLPSGEVFWGSIVGNTWGDAETLVACREIGNELGYTTVGGIALTKENTPDGEGKVWWDGVDCGSGSSIHLESCSKQTTTETTPSHSQDIGVACMFLQQECEACSPGKFNDEVGSSPCGECGAGTYSDATGSSSCEFCGEGKASWAMGASSESACVACSSSQVVFDDRSHCTCELGSGANVTGPTSPALGQLQDGFSIRIKDGGSESPLFDSEGVVEGRIEVLPLGETSFGTIKDKDWDDNDALVACRQIGNELGFLVVDGGVEHVKALSSNVPEGTGEQWWEGLSCSGSEKTLEECSKETPTSTSHVLDAGIRCRFHKANACATCPAGKFNDAKNRACESCAPGHYSHEEGRTTTCDACKSGKITAGSGESSCEACPPSSSTLGVDGASKCASCPFGLVTEDGGHCIYGKCEPGEFNDGEGKCEECKIMPSALTIFYSLVTFYLVCRYVGKIKTGNEGRQSMVKMKVVTTFFQIAEITMMTRISWPSKALAIFPFKFPAAEIGCLLGLGGEGLFSYESSAKAYAGFFFFTWGPVVLFLLMWYLSIGETAGSRQALTSQLLTLMMLWYTPILQIVGSMYDCFEDPERPHDDGTTAYYLVFDSNVQCNPREAGSRLWRDLVGYNSAFIILFVGIGFPAFVVFKVHQLKKGGKLNGESIFESLYQPYNRKHPYFEALQFLRKALLIFSMSILGYRRADILCHLILTRE